METFLALGSNLGDRLENLKNAINNINRLINTKVLQVSKVYETAPFDVLDKQDNYLNCCIRIKTEFSPEVLLGCCLGIEAAMGRTRPFFHASRVIDIDLLLYENIKVNQKDLVLPHPRMLERAFVLVPLLDVCEEPMRGEFFKNLQQLDQSGVELYLEDIKFE